MTEPLFEVFIPVDKTFFTVEDAPRLTARAIYPESEDEAFQSVLRRTACCGEHERHLANLIRVGEVTPLNPMSYVPEPDRMGAALKRALISLQDFTRFAASLSIGVSFLDDQVANKIGYTIRMAAKALAKK